MNLRAATISRVERLSAHLRRLTITGADMSGYLDCTPAQWVKMFIPAEDGSCGTVGRAYTIRRFRSDVDEVDIDCVLHENGPMSRWAAQAAVGQLVYLSGARGGFDAAHELPWLVLAGDTAALPAIGAIIESMPSIPAHVFVEVDDEDDLKPLPSRVRDSLHWGLRGGDSPGGEATLVKLIKEADLPVGQGRVWMAGEASLARAVRNHLLIDRLVPAKRIHSVGYWKRGEQDHRDMAAG